MQKLDSTGRNDKAPARARGRPRAFDREAALAKATRLFWARGYEATSISELTAAMEIGAPSLYAAFGSKEALYAEAVRYYRENYESVVWGRFFAAATAREAVNVLLMDSAAALTGSVVDIPHGCMVTLSSVGSEGHAELGDLVRAARAFTFDSLKARFGQAMEEGEIPVGSDIDALARFVQTVQNGMSILARDGIGRAELEAAADLAMAAWDARTGGGAGGSAPS
ncbi:TetR/AcrR family transcriptional regulator [Celeribacter indicus]|uniref:TetR family transcriptional regulator n=1 Tax=Celeribacter indicus TaxID=1208324 RepID=A0A0B5DRY6_9RHOB|nr:TetR/AcrR family transcriptional regulator [Celeribacter indicus]AJE45804.1 TetR family transcriptional regulator [Celeribacter indicus]SDW61063.1 transcriptional regulator, TetR family [Celeribacter indicus]